MAGAARALEFVLPDADATARVAALLAACLPQHLCVWLCGGLGAGKTCFARGLLRALGWHGAVRSPTYTLLEVYPLERRPAAEPAVSGTDAERLEAKSRLMLYHYDLYRMASPEEWVEAGFDDLDEPAVRLVEWPERGGARVPAADLRLDLCQAGNGRRLCVTAASPAGEETWHEFESVLQRQPAGSSLVWSRVC